MKKVGLYFGSFNPVHNGHLIVAQHMFNTGKFSKIRFVISPQNPFKSKEELIDKNLRMEMLRKAVNENSDFEVSDIEYHLPQPNYTIDTLEKLMMSEPETEFDIICGSDTLKDIHKWKQIETLAKLCTFHVYQRRGTEAEVPEINLKIEKYDAPFLDISATWIRQLLKENKSVRYLVPEVVYRDLQDS